METSWLPLLVAAAVLMAAVLLLAVCVDCRNHGPLASIPQTVASEDYIQSTDFRIIHPSRSTTDQTPMNSPSNLLPICPDHGLQRRPCSFAPTETDSNPSYENEDKTPQTPKSLRDSESEADNSSYIIVLPDGGASPCRSRASTSSSDAQPIYVNIKEQEESEEPEEPEEQDNYVNVDPSSSNQSDEEENYVNQPVNGAGRLKTEPSA